MATIYKIAETLSTSVSSVDGVGTNDIAQIAETDWSPIPSKLSTPTGLALTLIVGRDNDVQVDWNPPRITDDPYVSGWSLYRNVDGGAYGGLAFVTHTTGSSTDNTYLDVNVGNGITLGYKIQAISNANPPLDSDITSEVFIIIPAGK